MSSLTGKILNLIKPAVTDSVLQTIADLASNFQAIDDGHSAHLADVVTDADGVHGLKIESGTWTPAFVAGGVQTTTTYSKQIGTYRKINDIVEVWFALEVSVKGNPELDSYGLGVAGLPFVNTIPASATLGLVANFNRDVKISAHSNQDQTTIIFATNSSINDSENNYAVYGDIKNETRIRGYMSYKTY